MTWKNIFDIIENMWDVKQNLIATYLSVNASTISRLNNGKHHHSREITSTCLYDNIFNPDNPKSLACHQESHPTKKELSQRLTEAIQNLGVYDASIPINQNNYEQFIKDMPKNIVNQPVISSPFQNTVNNVPEVENQNQQNNTTHAQELSYVFYQSCENYGIENFIDQDPFKSLLPYQLEDAMSFIGHITARQKKNDSPDKNSDICQNIRSFTNVLLEYIHILYRYSDKAKTFPEDFTPIKSKEPLQEIDNIRKELKSLYYTIQASIEDDLNKYRTEQKLAGRKAWEECTHKGILFHIDE